MTLDEARLMANVNARALRLFEDGYRARWQGAHALKIRSVAGAVYRINTLLRTCDCPFFRGHVGRHSCKHVLGYRRLLARQRAARRVLALLLLRCWADLDDASLCAREADGSDSAQNTEAAPAPPERHPTPGGPPLFPLGRLVTTPAALTAFGIAKISPWALLVRHVQGDWGDLDDHERWENERALEGGARLVSAYDLPGGATAWIITEDDRSATKLLVRATTDPAA